MQTHKRSLVNKKVCTHNVRKQATWSYTYVIIDHGIMHIDALRVIAPYCNTYAAIAHSLERRGFCKMK